MLQSILYGLKKKVWVLLFYYLNVFVVSLKLTGELLKYSCASLPPPLVLVSMAVLGSVFLWRPRASKSCRRRCFSAPLLEISTARLNVEEVVSQTCYAKVATCVEEDASVVGYHRLAFWRGKKNSVFPAEESNLGRIFEFMMVEIIFEAHWATSGLKRRKAVLRAAGTETFMTFEKAAFTRQPRSSFLAFIVIFRVAVTGAVLGCCGFHFIFNRYFSCSTASSPKDLTRGSKRGGV